MSQDFGGITYSKNIKLSYNVFTLQQKELVKKNIIIVNLSKYKNMKI